MDSIQSSRVFGDYIIKRKIGAGGMASVFYAVHGETEKEVALKILHEHYADDTLIRKRLEHEARIVMRLKHPNIVSVLGFGETDRRPYLVMPYYPGGSLAEYFSKPRSVKHETTLKLLTILASALDYAHSQEVVHRDFKLENILIGQNNLPAISDFGIAQSAHTTRITMTGQILGTPQYLAPEVLDTNGNLNYKADYYALAVMAYLMLTGYFPFTAQDPLSLAIKHRTEHAPSPSIVNQALPTTVDDVFKRGLAKDPEARYPSAKEFVLALEEAFTYAALVTTQIFLFEQNPIPATQAATGQANIITPDLTNPDAWITRVLPPDEGAIPAVLPEPVERKKKRPAALYVALFMLLLCTTGSLLFFAISNGGLSFAQEDNARESAEETANAYMSVFRGEASEESEAEPSEESSEASSNASSGTGDDEEDVTATRRATNTPRATNTRRPSSTPTTRSGNTAVPSNTARPAASNTPRPLPSNTPQPQPSNVPPTNPPAPTSVPPTNPPAPTSVPPTSVPPTNPPPPPPTNPPDNGGGGGILNPVLEPVDTLVPCIPIPLVRTCD